MPRPNWQRVIELSLKEGACVCVWVQAFDSVTQSHQPAWGVFTLTQGDAVEVFVFAEDVDNASSNARTSAACFDAWDS